MRPTALVGVFALGAALTAQAQIVDHSDIDAVPTLPQSVMDAIGQQRWLFTHASVGGNMVAGLGDLNGANPTHYQLVTAWVGYNSAEMRADDPPAPTVPGTVYECDRGNPGWADKITIFDNSVRISGWQQPSVDVVMNKLCFIDQDANAADYISSMASLAADFPATVFVYTTMPLTTGEDADNVLRNQFNQAVRTHCASTGTLLFDIADMEAHDPAGTEFTFQYGGQTYQELYSGYTDDGGHLNGTGRQRIALGWYAVAAVLTNSHIFSDGFESGGTTAWSAVVP